MDDGINFWTQVSLQNITLETKEHKPHRFISLGWCRKKQVSSESNKSRWNLIINALIVHTKGFNLFGHCLLLVIFILSLVLIVALMYWMVSLWYLNGCICMISLISFFRIENFFLFHAAITNLFIVNHKCKSFPIKTITVYVRTLVYEDHLCFVTLRNCLVYNSSVIM